MSRWTLFNVIAFITIVLLAIVVRLTGAKKNDTPTESSSVPSASTTPLSDISATASGVLSPDVLGATVGSEAADLAGLVLYESARHSFMTMVPAGYRIDADVLMTEVPESDTDANPSAANKEISPNCTFTKTISIPGSVTEEKTLTEYDLPLVEYKKVKSTSQDPAATQTVYILKNEENVPKLQVNCSANWQPNESFYSIIRSVRFN